MEEKAMKEYEVTFWTEPTKFRYARIEKRYFKAKTRTEAICDAEDMFPTWSIIAIVEVSTEMARR